MARSKKKIDNQLVSLMQDITKDAKANKISIMDLDEFEETYGIRFYISTGLPSLDLHLFQNRANHHDELQTKPYGFPTGRISELCGDEGSYKTWMTHQLSAEVRKMGGIVFLIQTENDFDISFYERFYTNKGLDFETEVKPFVRASSATTVGEVIDVLQTIMPRIRDFHDKQDEQVPIMIVLDSLAAMFSTENLERFEKGDADRQGSHASEIHKMFKSVLEDLGRYNISFLVTNQYRAHMGWGNKTQKPAHNNTIRYYASLRTELSAYTKSADTVSRYGLKYQEIENMRFKVTKIRGPKVGDGTLEMRIFPNKGFDYLDSLLYALRYSRAAKKTSKGYQLIFEEEWEEQDREPTAVEQEVLQYMKDNKIDSVLGNDKKFRKLLKEHLMFALLLEKLVYDRGPHTLADIDDDEDLMTKQDVGVEEDE